MEINLSYPVQRFWPLLVFLHLVGFSFLAAGGYSAYSSRSLLNRAVEVRGEVVAMERRNGGSYPQIVYRDNTGTSRDLYVTWTTNPPSFYTGQKVTVLYDPADPDFPLHAKVRGFGELWGMATFCGAMGLAFTLTPLCVWLSGIPRRANHVPAGKKLARKREG